MGGWLTLHDVVAVGDETDGDGGGEDTQLPERHGSLGSSSVTGVPGAVDDSPGADGVTDIVGAVGEGGGAGGDDLDEGVGVLDLVGVLLGGGIDALHALAIRCTLDTGLSSVDVVVETVEEGDDDHGGEALGEGLDVVPLVDLAGAHGVRVKSAHGPAHGAALGAEVGVMAFLSLGDELFLGLLAGFDLGGMLLVVGLGDDASLGVGGLAGGGGGGGRLILLDDGVVGDPCTVALGNLALEEEGTHEDVVPAEGLVALEDADIDPGDEEEGGEEAQGGTGTEGDASDPVRGLLGETQPGGALVDDGECAEGAGDEEEEGRCPDGPLDGVLAHVDDELDHQEDGGSEAAGDDGSHEQASEDGTETLSGE